jgi:hypothetical protein
MKLFNKGKQQNNDEEGEQEAQKKNEEEITFMRLKGRKAKDKE